ncbi:hypothetical protein [Lacticaseibacillus rhamnosus]|uniref:hypothetical protein n=1 Tax=Lacticaseibacillus rhamnosus TaxID=47715 RepID=UPI0008A51073|nr:hypothetical protein [Lacticaseibacillus rhamnosus]MDE3301594.1 hypothetical protein [Lacticaseibacillus rhamnosus]OFP82996.1 hypothetical protein HMPREF2969_09555 [Lactobacillus sp. HMSC056D05]
MFSNNIKGKSKRIPTPPLRPPAPVLPKTEESLPTRANATKKYKDSLIAEVNEAINQGINTTSPISIGVSKYNPAVVNEVISLLNKSGWDVTGINIDGNGSYSTIIVS